MLTSSRDPPKYLDIRACIREFGRVSKQSSIGRGPRVNVAHWQTDTYAGVHGASVRCVLRLRSISRVKLLRYRTSHALRARAYRPQGTYPVVIHSCGIPDVGEGEEVRRGRYVGSDEAAACEQYNHARVSS